MSCVNPAQNAPFVRALVSEVWDETLDEDVAQHFPSFERMREADEYHRKIGKPTTAMLSMWRKIYLCNELRRSYETHQRRGVPYLGVVRARPDIAYGSPVHLADLAYREAGSGLPVLYTPVPPEDGRMWRLCENSWLPANLSNADAVAKLRHRPPVGTCADVPSRPHVPIVCKGRGSGCAAAARANCVESPLLPSLRLLVECPCCRMHDDTSAMAGVPVCSCKQTIAAHYTGGGTQNPHAFARADLARHVALEAATRGDSRDGSGGGGGTAVSSSSSASSSSQPLPAWRPWSGYYVLDQLAIAHGEAMDMYAHVHLFIAISRMHANCATYDLPRAYMNACTQVCVHLDGGRQPLP